MDERGSILGTLGEWTFSLHHCNQAGSGAHTAPHPVGTGRNFPEGKTAGA